MKKPLSLLLICTSAYVFANDYQFVVPEQHVHFEANYTAMGSAKVRHSSSPLHYREGYASLFLSHYVHPENALSWELGTSFIHLGWKQNPRFRQQDYPFAIASLGWISESIDKWRWVISETVSVDARNFDFANSAVYYTLLWGRYCFGSSTGVHIGVLAYAGVKNHYVLPVLGFDWTLEKWKINAIFPFDMSVERLFNEYSSLSLAYIPFGGPYHSAKRAHGGIGKYKHGIFEVYSRGLELDLNIKSRNWLKASVGAGWNFGGWILIKDRHNRHGKYYHFNGTPYLSADFSLTF